MLKFYNIPNKSLPCRPLKEEQIPPVIFFQMQKIQCDLKLMSLLRNSSCQRFLLFIILLFSIQVNAQELDLKKLIDSTNSFYGASDLLNLGEIYRPEHVYARGHPYFVTDEYAPASITVSNTSFENVQARYNIEMDKLIIKARTHTGLIVNMITKEDWVSSFMINNHFFLNLTKIYPGKDVQGYCEQVYKGEKTFFIKYKKKFIDYYDDNTPLGFFSVLKIEKYIYDKGAFIPVDTKKAFLKQYSDKKSINKFMKTNKIKYSKASSDQLKMLMQFCNGLSKSN